MSQGTRRDAPTEAFWRAFNAHDAMALNEALDQLDTAAAADNDDSSEIAVDAVDDSTGLSALHRLVQEAHTPEEEDAAFRVALCVDTVVRRCHADVDVLAGAESAYDGFSPLLLAAHFDDDTTQSAPVFRALLRTGATLDLRTPDGFSVAHVAAAAHNFPVLDAIADIAAEAPATDLARRRAAAAAQLLVSPATGGRAVTPLMLATSRGSARCVDVLLKSIRQAHGPAGLVAAIGARDADGRTALHHAFQVPVQAVLGDSYVVPIDCIDAALQLVLLSDGSLDIDAKDDGGVAATDYAYDTLYAVLRDCAAKPQWFLERNLTSLFAIANDKSYERAPAFAAEMRALAELERGVMGGCPVMNKNGASRNYGKMRRGEIARPAVVPTQQAVAEATSDAAAKCPFVSKQRQALEQQQQQHSQQQPQSSGSAAKCPIPSPRTTLNVVSGVVAAVVVYGVVKHFWFNK